MNLCTGTVVTNANKVGLQRQSTHQLRLHQTSFITEERALLFDGNWQQLLLPLSYQVYISKRSVKISQSLKSSADKNPHRQAWKAESRHLLLLLGNYTFMSSI